MLKKVKFVCGKCGFEFSNKKSCETHEKWCTPIYRLRIEISLFTSEHCKYKGYAAPTVNVNPTTTNIEKEKINTVEFDKRIYTTSEDDTFTELETSYKAIKTVLRDADLKKELNHLNEQLISFINTDLDKQKESVLSEKFNKKLDTCISAVVSKFDKNSGD